MLMEVHKFSKFIHGSAVLLPDEVRAVPYWIDDPSIRDSIIQSGAEAVLSTDPSNVHFTQLLPHDAAGSIKAPIKRVADSSPRAGAAVAAAGGGPVPSSASGGPGGAAVSIIPRAAYEYLGPEEDCCERWGCEWAVPSESDHVTQQKVSCCMPFCAVTMQ
jgi:hypothetical protein